jgi:hypothetical protein
MLSPGSSYSSSSFNSPIGRVGEVEKVYEHHNILYSSRRKFLASAGKSSLQAPPEFRTKQQARRKVLQQHDSLFAEANEHQSPTNHPRKRESGFALQNLLVTPKRPSVQEQVLGSKIKKAAKMVMESFVIDYNSLYDPVEDHWKEENTAGVKYWVNKFNGDVTTECPWSSTKKNILQLSNSKKRIIDSPMTAHDVQNCNDAANTSVDEGTGSLVYDNTEVNELFSLLDSLDRHCSPVKSLPIKRS